MNTEEALVKASCAWGHEDAERGLKPARDGELLWRSVEILRDLGLSKEKIVAYHRRFPIPTPTTGEPRRHRQGERQNAAHK
jgi:hypothetical protein